MVTCTFNSKANIFFNLKLTPRREKSNKHAKIGISDFMCVKHCQNYLQNYSKIEFEKVE